MSFKQDIEAKAQQVLTSISQSSDPKAQFCQLWTNTMRPVLEKVKEFTGPKVDNMINQLETAADGVCNGTNPDVQNFCTAWKDAHLDTILRMIEIFLGPNAKKALNKFIEIADSLCPNA